MAKRTELGIKLKELLWLLDKKCSKETVNAVFRPFADYAMLLINFAPFPKNERLSR